MCSPAQVQRYKKYLRLPNISVLFFGYSETIWKSRVQVVDSNVDNLFESIFPLGFLVISRLMLIFANYHFISHLKNTTIQYPKPIRNNRPHITGNMQPSPNKASNTVKQIRLYSFFISFSCKVIKCFRNTQ